MNVPKDVINFNKEILFGEIGAVFGALIFGYFFSYFFSESNVLSTLTLLGAIIGASFFWISIRIYDKSKNREFSKKGLLEDIAYFSPAAFILTSFTYYPILFFLSRYFLENQKGVFFSVFVSQISAFGLFLFSINLYKYLLMKTVGKKL